MYNYFNWVLENTQKTVHFIKAVNELNKLSDENLKELGLTRKEIYTAAYKSIYLSL